MNAIDLYQRLADAHHAQGKYQERDRFLVLALDAAHQAGQPRMAETLRHRLLEANPNHLIKPYGSFAEALHSPNFSNYLEQLRRNYPASKAQSLLSDWGTMSLPSRPKTGLAHQPFIPSTEPGEELTKTPTWSQVQIDIRSKVEPHKPTLGILTSEEPMHHPPLQPTYSVSDPLPPEPLSLAPALPSAQRHAPPLPGMSSARPPAPPTADHQGKAALGTILFALVLTVALATFSYIFVWPFLKS